MSPWRLDSFEKPMPVEAKSQGSEKFPKRVLPTPSRRFRQPPLSAAVAAPWRSGRRPLVISTRCATLRLFGRIVEKIPT
jgi:hypothetical protein